MTRKPNQARIQRITQELVTMAQMKFPRVELLKIEELPTGSVELHLFTPYEDRLEILESLSSRVVDLLEEGLHLVVLPHRHRPEREKAA